MIRQRALSHGVFGVETVVVFFWLEQNPSKSISEALCSGQTPGADLTLPSQLPRLSACSATITVTLPHLRVICTGIRVKNTFYFFFKLRVLLPDFEPGPFHSWGIPSTEGGWPSSCHYREEQMDGRAWLLSPIFMKILNNAHEGTWDTQELLETWALFPPARKRSRIPSPCWQKYSCSGCCI